MISLTDVGYSYHAATGPVRALTGVELDVPAGQTVCVVGANGSGKSTLALLCNGLLVPDEGSVVVDGMSTGDAECVWDVRSRVGLVLQDPDDQIVGTSVEADTAFGPENLGVARPEIRERIDRALDVVGLGGLEAREPHLLSEGQKQRLAIAGALAMRPAYLVLDEPTAMLDPVGRRDVVALVRRLAREEGVGILHVTHRLEELAGADRVVALSRGSIVFQGPPSRFLEDEALMSRCAVTTPPVWRLARGLREAGVPIPGDAVTPESLVEALPC
jgi:energy-coupling factor transport system ATP-binding protein